MWKYIAINEDCFSDFMYSFTLSHIREMVRMHGSKRWRIFRLEEVQQ